MEDREDILIPNMDVTVIVPAKNEEKNIGPVIDAIKKSTNAKIIVIDDNSSDNTSAIVKQRGIKVLKNPGKPGKGRVIKFAIDNVTSDIIVFMDADLSHNAEDIPSLVKPIVDGEASMVVASRLIVGSEELFAKITEWIRGIGVVLSTHIINLLYNIKLTDIHNGFRSIKLDIAKQLNLKEPSYWN